MSMSAPLLELDRCTLRFGGLTAVGDLSFAVEEGALIGLIGPNGAGKTSVFNLITGVYRPTAGDVRFAGQSLLGLSPTASRGCGIARTFQNIRLFPSLSVFDNVRVAFHQHLQDHSIASLLRRRGFMPKKAQIARAHHRAAGHLRSRAGAPTSRRRACPMATSAAWRSCARWPRSRSCCCWTSRPPA